MHRILLFSALAWLLGLVTLATSTSAEDRFDTWAWNRDGRQERFRRNGDNTIWHKWQTRANDDGSWTGWAQIPGLTRHPPFAITNVDGRMELFVIALSGAMVHIWQIGPGGSWTGDWPSLGGNFASQPWGRVLSGSGALEVCAHEPSGIARCSSQARAGQGPWSAWR